MQGSEVSLTRESFSWKTDGSILGLANDTFQVPSQSLKEARSSKTPVSLRFMIYIFFFTKGETVPKVTCSRPDGFQMAAGGFELRSDVSILALSSLSSTSTSCRSPLALQQLCGLLLSSLSWKSCFSCPICLNALLPSTKPYFCLGIPPGPSSSLLSHHLCATPPNNSPVTQQSPRVTTLLSVSM